MNTHWPIEPSHRPREKLLQFGPQTLSEAELLAILLRTGDRATSVARLADRILHEHHGLAGLGGVSVDQLQSMAGIGTVKAITIVAAIELARRWNRSQLRLPDALLSSQDVFDRYHSYFHGHAHEQLLVVSLDAKNRPLRESWMSDGVRTGVLFQARQIFAPALACHAVGLLLVHNHPSGEVHPSPHDLAATEELALTGKLLNLPLLDHLIVGDAAYFSLRDEGMLDSR